MTIVDSPRASSKTLAKRMTEGRIPVPDVLQHAVALAESIRKIHDDGHAHGAIDPRLIVVDGSEWELLPASHSVADGITPYTSPEVVQGNRADVRSDIFSFGALLYELLSGRPAFEGDNTEELATSIVGGIPEPIGKPDVDRVLSTCLARDPSARYQGMKKLLMELKMVAAAARRNDALTPKAQQIEIALRQEMRQLEQRLSSQLDSCERAVLDVERAATDGLKRVQDQLGSIASQLSTAQDIEKGVVRENIARLEKSIQAGADRLVRLEHGLESVDQDVTAMRESLNADIHNLERTIRTQAAAIEAARTAISQTDNLVERVVEELESLQVIVLGGSGESISPKGRG
jgi:methyl-accepting chemotaxis protein